MDGRFNRNVLKRQYVIKKYFMIRNKLK